MAKATPQIDAPAGAAGERLFQRPDWISALVVTLVSGAVYFYTAMPNVGLLDSGEFIVAAQHFGVPHPTGYPLWTLLAWLFQLLPIGNAAWEINLFSGLCGALAVGLAALLGSSMLRWMMPEWGGKDNDRACAVIAAVFALLFAFSFSFWTQAVIAEVYTLHGLLVGLFLLSLYWWVRRPERDLPILAAFFTFSLCMSNHHLTLALAPLPLLIPLLIRRSVFWEVLVASLLSAAIVYLGFGWLSNDGTTWSTAMRFFYFALLALIVLLVVRWRRTDLRVIFLVPLAVIVGLLPYAYMPIASSTNPPMNWGYTSTPEGFFYSINRTQYSGSLSDLAVRTLGKAMGTAPEQPPEPELPGQVSTLQLGREFTAFYCRKLVENFTPWCFIAFVAAVLALLPLGLRQRTFLYVLLIGFFLAAFLQPIMERTQTTIDAWSLQFPYHGYAYLLFALVCAAGTGYICARLSAKRPLLGGFVYLLPLLPLWTALQNAPLCSQRDHWFGYDYGRDMLKDLPRDAFVFGGTDPGRFVPTYMILGESFVDPKHRQDPDFDRRDLVIVTQNALADAFYQKYIHAHYAPGRPEAKGWFEHWLGRDKHYPPDETLMPTDQQLMEIIKAVTAGLPPGANPQDPSVGILYHAAIAKWIFENNKHRRDFFIEESFPMEWTYPYAVPNGLSYRLNKEPLETLPEEAVADDFKFWNAYVDRLLGNPNFHEDFDAQRSFSKLRNSTGNIYRARRMWPEAERAYRQALQLHPNNMETLVALSDILRAQKRWDEMAEIWDRAIEGDPSNRSVRDARARVTRFREADREIDALRSELAMNPQNPEVVSALVRLYAETGQPDLVRQQLESSSAAFGDNIEFLKFAVDFCNNSGQWGPGLEFARKLSAAADSDPGAWLALARFEFANRQSQQFLDAARKAVQLGGAQAKVALANDPMYAMVRGAPEFQQLLQQ
ncbi:MAG: protein O-mannosyl-transferase family [Chthoniobacterales bacterium]|jgi:tetratricopeptide (TPR) repeat protein